jgi:hypothetical protein
MGNLKYYLKLYLKKSEIRQRTLYPIKLK